MTKDWMKTWGLHVNCKELYILFTPLYGVLMRQKVHRYRLDIRLET